MMGFSGSHILLRLYSLFPGHFGELYSILHGLPCFPISFPFSLLFLAVYKTAVRAIWREDGLRNSTNVY